MSGGVDDVDPSIASAKELGVKMKRSLRLLVPGLSEAPFIGDGCCSVMPAEDVLTEQLGDWPGVLNVKVAIAGGLIDLELDWSCHSEEDLVGTVSDLGYRVEAVQVFEDGLP